MRFGIPFISLLSIFSTFCLAQQNLLNNHTPQQTDVSYQTKLKLIEAERLKLANLYRNSVNKNDALEKTRTLLISSIDQNIFPYWYGTAWDFYGTTQTPKEGKIACGYFVTTVLRDVGVKLNRVSLAQQASENIIKSLTTEPFIKRFRNVAIDKFVEEISKLGAGLYIVGLDNHVGFILNDGNKVYFVHSSYVEPSEVIKEIALNSPILSNSKYRVVGKISADDSFLRKWLNQSNFITQTR